MTTHSSILTWKIPWAEDWWATVHGAAESDRTDHACVHTCTHTHTHTHTLQVYPKEVSGKCLILFEFSTSDDFMFSKQMRA